jgi:hypothetical protein
MVMRSLRLYSLAALLFSAACATTQPVDRGEMRTAVGRMNDVRVTAQLATDHVAPAKIVTLTYEIENLRSLPIAFAELVPEVSYDPAAKAINVALGTEVPGNEILPRLTRIPPGEKVSFSTGLRIPMVRSTVVDASSQPRTLQISAHILGDITPFGELIDIPERAVHSPKLADELFTKWIENNETIVTSAIPIEWSTFEARQRGPSPPPRRRPRP